MRNEHSIYSCWTVFLLLMEAGSAETHHDGDAIKSAPSKFCSALQFGTEASYYKLH